MEGNDGMNLLNLLKTGARVLFDVADLLTGNAECKSGECPRASLGCTEVILERVAA